jgi:ATP-dependent Lon protease
MTRSRMKDKRSESARKRGDLSRFPLLPLRDIVIFPQMVVPLFVGREKSIAALEEAMIGNKEIFLAAQKDAGVEDPTPDDIFSAGTVCQIVQLLKLPDGTVKVLVEGKRRGIVVKFISYDTFCSVEVARVEEGSVDTPEVAAQMRGVLTSFESYVKLSKNISSEVFKGISGISDAGALADGVISHLNLKNSVKQELLSTNDPGKRLECLLSALESEISILQIEKRIKARVKKQMERTQKEYYLNEQMRAIQKELGGNDDFRQELRELEEKIAKLHLSAEARQKAFAELKKLRGMSPMSAEAAVARNYVDWIVSLPWSVLENEKNDLAEAEAVLNAEHYGLEKVKERILEYLAVNALVEKNKGPILCLVGPPGVGKTSLARSIARATGRSFVKISLGGVRDEAEIRGHRRTYVGAMPGKIIQCLKKVGNNNPVFLLDEIDKMSSDFRGDPSSALLEVLDPEQNVMFSDHFLDLDYDLSHIMFITTANSIHTIPRPLLDRMEVIKLDGYSEREKLSIARQYLLNKQLDVHGLSGRAVTVSDRALLDIIRLYTREAGVRHLEREIAAISRKIARAIVGGSNKRFELQPRHIRDYLGLPRFRFGVADENDTVGAVTGLAWTEAGGDLLTIEATVIHGTGKLIITGKLGDVMQESVQAAMTYVRSRSKVFGLENDFYNRYDVHIHVPEGAIPKDGPSAGIAMATAIISALTGTTVRRDMAMTGEITLRGMVLPIGGVKQKLMAAKRGNIRTVLIPKENENELAEIDNESIKGMKIHAVSHMDDVIAFALTGMLVGPAYSRIDENRSHFMEEAAAAH